MKVMGEKTIGIIGGGQLGRMLTLAALPLGFKVIVLDPKPGSPASKVGAEEITADLYDKKAIKALAKRSDYITVEIEHLDAKTLEVVAKLGKSVNPAPKTIQMLQDKFLQKEFLHSHKIAVAPFKAVENYEDAKVALDKFGGQIILKTRHGAYDGRGNYVVDDVRKLKAALKKFGERKLYAEAIIRFKKELAVIVARDTKGNVKTYPIVETQHQRNICVKVTAPAQISQRALKKANKLAANTAKHLTGAGVFAIEMFLTKDDNVLVNEIAPRVHNSGHFTIDACSTSQFEQHIRAVTDLPLGDTSMLAPAAVMINILGERNGETRLKGLTEALSHEHVSIHIYGKSPTKKDRKMGHITALGKDVRQANKRASLARSKIMI